MSTSLPGTSDKWACRCRQTLYAFLSGQILLDEAPPAWVQRFTLPGKAQPHDAVLFRVSNQDQTLGLSERDSPLIAVSVPASGDGLALSLGGHFFRGMQIRADQNSGSFRIAVTGVPRHALALFVPEERASPFVVLLHRGEDRTVSCGSDAGAWLLALYAAPDPLALLDRADSLCKQDRWKEALCELDRSLQLDGAQCVAWRLKAVVLRQLNRRDEGLGCADRALELHPGYALGWRTKGALLRDAGRHQEGLECYERGLALDPSDEILWQNKVNALRALDRAEDAAETVRQFTARFPGKVLT
jgi:tetratricopeptide (TPR) repeat protein